MSQAKVFELDCAIQNYAWGKVGSDSEVARLCQHRSDFKLDETATYAELWMGAHTKAPSVIHGGSTNLATWLAENKACLGEKVREHFPNEELPFLFKVLSVNKALSIQAHPNKSHAEHLRRTRPEIYPDDNHKPEIAIALTEFEGLCGFRPLEEIITFLKEIKEFHTVVGESAERLINMEDGGDAAAILKACFTSLMTCDREVIKSNLASLVNRLTTAREQGERISHLAGDLFLRVHGQFPGDIGCFCIFFLTHQVLAPGEAMFLEANLPHAYLAGDCIECMACSDNVVRAGLTPKLIDAPTLCEMLLYESRSVDDNMFPAQPDLADPYLTVYNPPIPDFTVAQVKVPPGVATYIVNPVQSASILLTIEGEGSLRNDTLNQDITFRKGTVMFISANETVSLNIKTEGVLMFRAYCQL